MPGVFILTSNYLFFILSEGGFDLNAKMNSEVMK